MKYVGYWNDILEDEELLPDYEEILEDTYEGTQLCTLDFLHGFCACYAYELWTQDNKFKLYTIKDYSGNLIHAYCVYFNPNTKETWYMDIRGATTNPVPFFDEFEVECDKYGEVNENWFTIENCREEDIDDFVQFYQLDLEDQAMTDAKIFVDLFMSENFNEIN